MAFCNSCGATLDPGTRFCNKCGAAVLSSSPAPAATTFASQPPAPVAATPASGGSALKIILIVVGVVVLMGILGMATIGFIGWRIARNSHVRQDGNQVRVETPFGTVESTKDPEEVMRNLGVDVYPGATLLRNGANSATFGKIHTATANLESSDSLDSVASFYKSKFPNATVTTSDQNRCTIVSNDNKSMITINLEAEGGGTRIHITNVTHKS